jgi:hypothetical protein
MLVLFLSFATSLGALAVAGASASVRCGEGSDCSSELALAVVAAAPASLIGILALLLLRTKATRSWVRTLLLAIGVGVAAVPLAAFMIRDAKLLPVFAILVATTVLLVVWGERGEPDAAGVKQPAADAAGEGTSAALSGDSAGTPGRQPAARPPAQQALAVLDQVGDINYEIMRLCERLTRLAPAPARPVGRRRPYR